MTAGLVTAIVSAITSLIVALGSQYFATRAAHSLEKTKERDRITGEYLNPLRLYLEETYARLSRIEDRLKRGGGICDSLLSVESPEAINDLPDDWFTSDGYYLMSSCYLTACLFFHMDQVRSKAPYLPLEQGSDTELVNRLFQISLALGKTGGIYYILQGTLAEAMAGKKGRQVISYRTFCEKFRNPQDLIWFKQLVAFYLAIGQGKKGERIDQAKVAIIDLLRFLEEHLGGGTAIENRIQSQERI